jgi:phosphoglycerate dehydrogenase-like enzyme
MSITAVRRIVRGDEPVRTIATEQLDEHLPHADHVIDVLPSGQTSASLFTAARFARMKPTAAFYNVGRGDTVDQPALLDALTQLRIAAAYLDVTTPEPLPADHPLWLAPNCYITPHLAGGQQDEMRRQVEHFLANLARFDSAKPLFDRIV